MTLISATITAGVIWLVHKPLMGVIQNYLAFIPWEFAQTTGASVVSVVLAYMLFILTLSVVTSLMSEPLLIALAKKHYPEYPAKGSPTLRTSLALSLKSGLLFLGTFLLTFPLMFIPLVGAVYMLWLWSLLIKKPTHYDVTALFFTPKEQKERHIPHETLFAMIASGFNYIPLLNIFAPVFAQILYLHAVLKKEEK